jgi:ribosome-associated protein
MAKKIVKKSPVKGKTPSKPGKRPAKKGVKKAPVKREISEKEKEARQANFIANSEKKKKTKRPKKVSSSAETSGLLDAIVDGMQEKKAKNITIINLTTIENRVCDYFVICDADSKTHVDAIADSVEEVVEKKTKEKAYHSEGYENSEWILIDYINIVAHVFLKETRDFYNIEALWADAEFKYVD